jgi:5-formyltetrahydrofolate cyclo-ligase
VRQNDAVQGNDAAGLSAVQQAKARLRAELLGARKAMSADDLDAARAAVRRHVMDRAARDGWQTVAAYAPLRTEPGSLDLLDALAAGGAEVIVPFLLPDRDLDWFRWHGAGPVADPPLLGPAAIGAADAVLVPALAVSRAGMRLGRGGGSYDRALARVRPGRPSAALLFEGELLDAVPAEPWDRPVTAAVRPSGWLELPGNAGQGTSG